MFGIVYEISKGFMVYQVVERRSLEELGFRVTELMKDGWKPHGNLIVIRDKGTFDCYTYFQPMIKVTA